LALAVVVHKQWSQREHLPYPIVRFATTFLRQGASGGGRVTARRGFRMTCLCVFALHGYKYLCLWWPGALPEVPLQFDFSPLEGVLPALADSGRILFRPRIILSVVGLAFFFASDVSFSMAVMPVMACFAVGTLTHYGVFANRSFLHGNTNVFMIAGSYFGILLVILYIGRRYYWDVLCRSVGLPTREPQAPGIVWSSRISIAAFVILCLQLVAVGLNWALAILFVAMAIMILLVNSRALAETGAFYIGTYIMPDAILLGLLGSQVMGPEATVIMGMLSVVFLAGPGWGALVFGGQALQLVQTGGVRVARAAPWALTAAVVTLAVSVPAILYWQYDRGIGSEGTFAHYLAQTPFEEGLRVRQQLWGRGLPADTAGAWSALRPDGTLLTVFAVAALLAVLVAACRLRLPWWPLHPIALVFLGTQQAQAMAFSFFLGWVIKSAVTRFGGGGVYTRMQPVMLGLIAGEILAALLVTVIGLVYYLATGLSAPSYSIAG